MPKVRVTFFEEPREFTEEEIKELRVAGLLVNGNGSFING